MHRIGLARQREPAGQCRKGQGDPRILGRAAGI